MIDQTKLRNIAIIAHVDHGKTTLVDGLLKQSGLFRDNQAVEVCVMDSNDLERERGITILAKNCSLMYHGVKINIIDTPGHADFGGEVERVLKMADGVLLLVDAFDGPMPQTRFVLKKALGHHLKPILVVNKIDRPEARPLQVVDEVLDLFIDLGAHEDQLDFPVVYASGRQGVATLDMKDEAVNLEPLFRTILDKVPAPLGGQDEPLQMLVSNIDYSSYTGRIAIGRLFKGSIRTGQQVALLRHDRTRLVGKVVKLEAFTGLGKREIPEAFAGDIVAVTGLEDVHIGETIADIEKGIAMEYVSVDEPTISMNFLVNASPFAGAEGKFVTSRLLAERLDRELKSNVALRVERAGQATDAFCVSGRGLLHLSILIETMRREGFELAVSKPQVILKEIEGQTCEPVEWVVVDTPEEYAGKVIELMGMRKGAMESMATRGTLAHIEFKCPSRGLIGMRNRLLNITRGTAVLNHVFHEYEPFKGEIPHRNRGVIVASDPGRATTYALTNLADRGTFFVNPGDEVYVGMIVGEHCHESDIEVNIAKSKHLTNMRAAGKDATVKLQGVRIMSLEEALEYIEDDEFVEVTPKSIRLRKICLDAKERKRRDRDAKTAAV